jgi:hypothetical protein
MKRLFAKRMKECPHCESGVVHRSPRQGFEERFVHPFFFLWPYECRDCKSRFLGFHSRYCRPYVKPGFDLAKSVSVSPSR